MTTYDLKKLIQQGNEALKDNEGPIWSAAVEKTLAAVEEALIPFAFQPDNPIMLAVFCRLTGKETARLAQSQEHMYGGMQMNFALVEAQAQQEWDQRVKAHANATSAIRRDN